jgi:uncharacterized membrane protein
MLSVMSLAYQDFTPEQLTVGGKIEDYRKRLFATYIDRMFQRRGTTQQYSREDSQRWLIWLAQRMKFAAQTEFLIEGIQPSWLISKKQLILYYVKPSLTNKIIIKILLKKIITVDALFISKANVVKYFRFGLINSITASMIYSMLPESYWDKSYKSVLNSIVFYLRNYTIHLEDFSTRLLTGIVFGLILSLQSGLVMLLINGISSTEIQQTEKPNEGIYRSIFNANILMIVFVLAIWLVNFCLMRMADFEFVKLNGLLFFGVIGWLIGGGYTSLCHFILRVVFYSKKYSPWNYARFLDYATDRLFMQKVGGGYIFVHRMLLEHFAEMSIEQEKC